jgi:protein involved in polysaccharide export with SLBB domain
MRNGNRLAAPLLHRTRVRSIALGRIAFALLGIALAGCETRSLPEDQAAQISSEQVKRLSAVSGPQNSVIGADDLLEVTYLKRYADDQSRYRFDVGDSIELQFFTHPDQPQTYTVQPDGRIYLPEIGSLMVRGLSADEVQQQVVRGYKGTSLAGPVNVVARVTDAKVNELLKSIGEGTNGSTRSVRVLADGTISLPLIDVVAVAGDTVGEIQQIVNERYGLLFSDLHVSVTLQENNSRRFGVLGEVNTPGLYPISGQTTLLDALTKAGGVKVTAKHGSGGTYFIVLLRRTSAGGVQTEQIQIDSDTAIAHLASLDVRPSDILYVPTSHIAELDRFVQQYIVQILPFSTSLGYGFSTPTTAP